MLAVKEHLIRTHEEDLLRAHEEDVLRPTGNNNNIEEQRNTKSIDFCDEIRRMHFSTHAEFELPARFNFARRGRLPQQFKALQFRKTK